MPIPARVAQWNKVGLNRVVRRISAGRTKGQG